jgi:1-deoxy-D-xylulose-5-phosphate synthase
VEEFDEALLVRDAPTIVRYPKAPVGDDIAAVERVGGVDVLHRGGEEDVLLVSVGALAGLCLDVAGRLRDQGVGVTVVDPRWVKPIPDALTAMVARHRLVVVVEDGLRAGGVGATLSQHLQDARLDVPVRSFGIPLEFLEQGSRAEVLAECGLTAQDVSRSVVETMASLDARRQIAAEVPPIS